MYVLVFADLSTSHLEFTERDKPIVTDGDNHTPPMVETTPSPAPTSTVVDLNDPGAETVTAEERKALIAKNNEFAVRFFSLFLLTTPFI